MKDPLVSVVLPTFKRPERVGRAIQSVLGQTFVDFELLVVDDDPNHTAKELVTRYVEEDTRVHYIPHERNKGCSGAKNTGFHEARGKYVAILDDDDAWWPEKLEKQVAKMEATSEEVGFSFTAVRELLDGGKTNITHVPDGVGNYHELVLSKFNACLSVTLMFRREVFEQVGYMNEEFPTHTDIELLIRVTEKYRGVGLDEPLVDVTMATDYECMNSSMTRRIKGRHMILEKYKDKFEERPKFLGYHLTQLGRFYRNDGRYREAKEIFKKAWQTHFTVKRFFHYASMFFDGLLFRLFRMMKGKKSAPPQR